MDKNKVIAEKLFPAYCYGTVESFTITQDEVKANINYCRSCSNKTEHRKFNFYKSHEDMQDALDRVGELGLQPKYLCQLILIVGTKEDARWEYLNSEAVKTFDLVSATLEQKADALFELVKEME